MPIPATSGRRRAFLARKETLVIAPDRSSQQPSDPRLDTARRTPIAGNNSQAPRKSVRLTVSEIRRREISRLKFHADVINALQEGRARAERAEREMAEKRQHQARTKVREAETQTVSEKVSKAKKKRRGWFSARESQASLLSTRSDTSWFTATESVNANGKAAAGNGENGSRLQEDSHHQEEITPQPQKEVRIKREDGQHHERAFCKRDEYYPKVVPCKREDDQPEHIAVKEEQSQDVDTLERHHPVEHQLQQEIFCKTEEDHHQKALFARQMETNNQHAEVQRREGEALRQREEAEREQIRRANEEAAYFTQRNELLRQHQEILRRLEQAAQQQNANRVRQEAEYRQWLEGLRRQQEEALRQQEAARQEALRVQQENQLLHQRLVQHAEQLWQETQTRNSVFNQLQDAYAQLIASQPALRAQVEAYHTQFQALLASCQSVLHVGPVLQAEVYQFLEQLAQAKQAYEVQFAATVAQMEFRLAGLGPLRHRTRSLIDVSMRSFRQTSMSVESLVDVSMLSICEETPPAGRVPQVLQLEGIHQWTPRRSTDFLSATKTLALYERAWKVLKEQNDTVPFGSIEFTALPWPIMVAISTPDDIRPDAVHAFLFHQEQANVRPITERPAVLRAELHRWHPDRFECEVVPKVKEAHRGTVREAAGKVAQILIKWLGSAEGRT